MPLQSSRNPTFSRFLVNAVVGAYNVAPADPLIDTAAYRLFSAGPLPITPDSLEADFTESAFSGYTAQSGSPAGPVNLPSGLGVGMTADALFTRNSGATSENVLGYYVTDANDNLIMAEYFDAPIPMENAGDFISLQIFLPMAFRTSIGT